MDGEDPLTRALIIAFLVCSLMFCAGCFVGVYIRRKVFPLTGRAVSLVLLMTVCIAYQISANLLRTLDFEACWFLSILRVADLVMLHLLLVRVARMWYKAKLSHSQLQQHQSSGRGRGRGRRHRGANQHEKLIEVESGRDEVDDVDVIESGNLDRDEVEVDVEVLRTLHRWSWLGDTPRIWKVLACCLTVDVVIVVALALSADDACQSVKNGSSWLFVMCATLVILVGVVFVGFKIYFLRDGYFIRQEFGYLLLAQLGLLVLVPVDSIYTHPVAFDVTYALILLFSASSICTFPVAKSYGLTFHPYYPWTWLPFCARSELSCMPAESKKIELIEILTNDENKELRADFEKHLSLEFSVENIAFWDCAREFKEMSDEMSDDELALRAAAIYFNFLMVGAPQEVNISSRAKQEVSDALYLTIENLDELRSAQLYALAEFADIFSNENDNENDDNAAAAAGDVELGEVGSENSVEKATHEDSERRPQRKDDSHPGRRRATRQDDDERTQRKDDSHHPRLTVGHQRRGATRSTRSRSRQSSSTVRVQLSDRVSNAVFDASQSEVYDLMARDCYKRWLATRCRSSIPKIALSSNA